MTPLEKRYKHLKELLAAEEVAADRSQAYIDDLKLSIDYCESMLPAMNKDGYRMVS